MNKRKISIFLLSLTLLGLTAAFLLHPSGSGAQVSRKSKVQKTSVTQGPANFDAFGQLPSRSGASLTDAAPTAPVFENGQAVQMEPRLDVPTFLWTSKPEGQSAVSGVLSKDGETAAARAHLANYASRYRLSKSDVAVAKIASVHDTGSGAIIVKFKQNVGGVEVFRDEINVVMNRNLEVLALSGYLTGDHASDSFSANDFSLTPQDALAKAISDLTGTQFDASGVRQIATNRTNGRTKNGVAVKQEENPYLLFSPASSAGQNFAFGDEPARVREVMFHLADGYVPSYYIETAVQVPSTETLDINGAPVYTELAYGYVISAADGRVLFRNNQTVSEVSTFRVWADPTTKIPYDTPAGNGVHPKISAVPDGVQYPFVAQNNITLNNYPFSMNDPWLPAGSTETVGNNADAYVNLINGVAPNYTASTTDNGYGPVKAPYDGVLTFAQGGGDFRSITTTNNIFTHTNDASLSPLTGEARQSDIQQLFYNINFLHDWFYDAGFNEASGNAQTDNFGRGGLGADNIKAQAQDISARNNANMQTPADGGRPRMRMYTFDTSAPKYLNVLTPAAIAGKRAVGTAQAGPQSFDMTNDIVYASPNNGCTAFTNAAAVSGKIAMVQYPATLPAGCSISVMISNAQNAGATGFLLVWVASSPTSAVNVTGANAAQTIPFLSISYNNADGIKTQLANGVAVTARFRRDAGVDRDGTIDNQIVFHEWGHYITNRLIGNGSGLGNTQGGGMGEGWGDFNAMLALTVRPDDVNVTTNTNWNGAYALATYATSGGAPSGPQADSNEGYYYGIRRTPYSTDFTRDPLTYKHITNGVPLPTTAPLAFGQDGSNNAEVHNIGEVWATMLWECYASLLRDTKGANPRLTFQQAQDRMKNYMVAAYKTTPSSPTILEARDALIVAAFANDSTDGALFAQAFAKRGAGSTAVAPDRNSTTNAGAVESYSVNGSLTPVSVSLGDTYRTRDTDNYLDNNERGLLTVSAKNNGATALSGATATISSNNASVSFPNGPTVTFPASQPGQTVTAVVVVDLTGNAPGIQVTDFGITFNDASFAAPVVSHFYERLNVNEVPASSKTDDVESKNPLWTKSFNASLGNAAPWVRTQAGSINHFWYAPDSGGGSDQYLTSPIFTVDGSGSFNVQFDHSWDFEFDAGGNYDGGVVEMSVNGGAFNDIGASAYNGTLLTYAGNVNPLQGRTAFVQSSNGTIHTSLTQSIAPGSTVQIRFRIASDGGGGANGWIIDNIAVGTVNFAGSGSDAIAGIVETPFATLVGDPNVGPTAAAANVSGRIVGGGKGLAGARIELRGTDGTIRSATTNSFGNFTVANVPAGASYVVNISAKRYTFSQQFISVTENLSGLTFTGQ